MKTIFGPESKIKEQLSYSKFKNESLRVLIPGKKYHLQRESQRALEALGHKVFYLEVPETAGELVRKLIETFIQFKPDMLLTINHIGFDAAGTIGQILDEIQLPVAAWYVDSPEFVLGKQGLPAESMTTVFMWERDLIPKLKAMGLEDIHYLPLASDISVFKPRQIQTKHDFCFVGDSMTSARQKWNARIAPAHQKIVEELTEALLSNRHLDSTQLIKKMAPSLNNQELADILGASTWEATAKYRNGLLRPFDTNALTIYGDKHWPGIMPKSNFQGYILYGEPLSKVYEQSCINLNATSLQMGSAVNQRVFDVPAAGGFILTDAQSDALEHFENEKEIITYNSADELSDKAAYYLKHESERLAIIESGHKKVMSMHTYQHRLQNLLSHMKTRHASPTSTQV
jgi:spore maturation protein CgeB